MFDAGLSVRVATRGDTRTLESLARLAHLARPTGPRAGKTLIAEQDGVAVAAMPLAGGSAMADPNRPTDDAERLLTFTRYRILRQGGQTGAARSLLRRRLRVDRHAR